MIFSKQLGLLISIIICCWAAHLVSAQVTIFDHLGIQHLRQGRDFLFRFSGATGHNRADFRTNLKSNVSGFYEMILRKLKETLKLFYPSHYDSIISEKRKKLKKIIFQNLKIFPQLFPRNYKNSSARMNHSFVMSMGQDEEVQLLRNPSTNFVLVTLTLSVRSATVWPLEMERWPRISFKCRRRTRESPGLSEDWRRGDNTWRFRTCWRSTIRICTDIRWKTDGLRRRPSSMSPKSERCPGIRRIRRETSWRGWETIRMWIWKIIGRWVKQSTIDNLFKYSFSSWSLSWSARTTFAWTCATGRTRRKWSSNTGEI